MLAAGDEEAARGVATDLLQDAVPIRAADAAFWLPRNARDTGDFVLTYRAGWLGSSTALQTFGVHHSAQVTPWDLSSVLLGRNARTGEQVQLPRDVPGGAVYKSGPRDLDDFFRRVAQPSSSLLSFNLDVPVPEHLTRLWVKVGPDERAGIERGIISTAGAALDHAVLTSPLEFGRDDLLGERPQGVAAIAIVNSPDRQVGNHLARWGPDLVQQLAPAPLELQLVIVGVQGPDGQLVTPTLRWAHSADREIRSLVRWTLIDEPTFFLHAMQRTGPSELVSLDKGPEQRPREGTRDRSDGAVSTEIDDEHGRPVDREPGLAGLAASDDDATSEQLDWTQALANPELLHQLEAEEQQHMWRIEEKLLIRELPVRLEHLRSDRRSPTGVPVVTASEQASRRAPTERALSSGERSPPSALEEFRELFGERRVEQLAKLQEQFRTWLESKPDAWVRLRRVELGPPDEGLNRGDARRALLLETKRARLEDRVTSARAEGKRLEDRAHALWASDIRHKLFRVGDAMDEVKALGEMAQVEFQQADKATAHLDEAKHREQQLRQQGRDLDSLMTRHATQLVVATAYTDDYERRRDNHVLQGVQAALDKAPPHIQSLIGPPPEKASPHHAEWEAITRSVESARVAVEFDNPDAIGQQPAELQLPATLARRIDRLRTERGMQPRAYEQQLGPAIQADGLEPL